MIDALKAKNKPFYFVVVAIFVFVISPAMFSDAMFCDGLMYAAISKNLANGLGSFWYLYFSDTIFPAFHEHPPLAFGIQSIFYKLFGDSLLIERFYSLLTIFISGGILICIWRKIVDDEYKSLGWLPLLFWLSIPLSSWIASNNMLENTMTIFTSLSVLFVLKHYQKSSYLYLFLSGVMIYLAFMSKGFVGLFVLSFPFWLMLFKRTGFVRFIKEFSVVFLGLLIPFVVVALIFPESIDSLTKYFNKQVVGSISSIQTVDSRFYIIKRLFNELIPLFIYMVIVFFITRKKTKTMLEFDWVYVFLGLGFSGVLPIMVSMKQSGFYMFPAFSAFALVLAYLIAPRVLYLVKKINLNGRAYSIFEKGAYVLILVSFVVAFGQVNKIGRKKDRDMLLDVYDIIEVVPHESLVTIPQNLMGNWSLHGYFCRSANISLGDQKNTDYYLVEQKDDVGKEGYVLVDLDLRRFNLYKKEVEH